MTTIVLALTELSCGHCIKNVKQTLEKLDGVENAEVTLNFAKINTSLSPQVLIDAITKAGYGAQVAQPNLVLSLGGLACGHCVKSVENALSAVENLDVFEVDKTEAKIYGTAQAQAVIDAIVNAGYEAVLHTENTASPKSDLPPASQQMINPDPVAVENKEDQVMLLLQGMSCAACVLKVQRALEAVPAVMAAQVNLAESTAIVLGHTEPQALIKAVENAGYGAELIEDEQIRREKQQAQVKKEIRQRQWQAVVALIIGFGLMLWGLLGGTMEVNAANQSNWMLVGLITLVVIALTGGHFYQRAVKNLVKKTATMDTLVALGTGVAWLYSMLVVLKPEFFPQNSRHLYFESSAMIIGLINVGKMLEAKAKQRSSQALERLLDLTPKTVRIVDEQGERDIPLAQVRQGMILRLQTGERVGVDGIVTQGEVWIDESMLTGEAIPVSKKISDKVIAGTLVTDGTSLFRAEQIGNQTTLANIVRLVRRAQSSKPQIGLLADKIAAIFVPVVIVIALLAALIWYVATDEISYSFVVLTSVLIIACPCALGLATPMSIIAGTGRAAELGMLVRDADALQKAATADTIVFDKTGTLTKGEPKVTAVYTFNGVSEQSAVNFSAVLEQGSGHPLAKAILTYAGNITLREMIQFRTLKGLGVSGIIDGATVLLGNRTLMQQYQIDTELAERDFEAESAKGATTVFLALEGQLAAMFAIRDPLREDSREALQSLHKQGYRLVMLTGDQEKTAQTIASEAGIDHVIAGVLPEGKAQVIQRLQQEGAKVIMVGDGINDAPALAQADVGIAMGEGSDIAMETAELTLMRHSLHGVADALALSKATLRNMRQNLFFAFVYNSLGIPLAAGVLYPFFGILLNPMIAGAAMAFSSITVVGNANRLLKFKPNN